MAFKAGSYTATLAASTLGQMQAGFTASHNFFLSPVTGDNFARTVQDEIFQGGDVSIAYTLLEFNAAAARTAYWPFGPNWLNMSTQVGNLVVQDELVDQLILTAVAGTPAATIGPATITLPRTMLTAGVDQLLSPELHVVPIRQRAYIDANGVFGTLT